MTTATPGRRRLLTLLLAGTSMLVALGLCELLVRWARPAFIPQPDPIRNPFWHYDAELGWAHEPGQKGSFSRAEFTHPVSINSLGWRDRERAIDKPAGVTRLAVLGDSFTWGHGVADEEIFTRLLERRLPGVEALNFGLSASATDQQLLILRRYALSYAPDLVLVMVSRNDFIGNLAEREGIYPKPRFVLRPGGALELVNVPVPRVPEAARTARWLRGHSALWNLIEWRFAADPERAQEPGADPYEMTCALLEAIRGEAQAAGARMAAALASSNAHTYLDPIPSLEARRFESVKECGAARGFPVLDLVPAFRAAARAGPGGGRVELFYPLDKHWNARGHEAAADELARLLAEEHLVPVGVHAGRL